MSYDEAVKRIEAIVRELEQGKATVRMDKVAQVFDLFGYELVPQKKVK